MLDSAGDGGTRRTSTRARTEWGFSSGANDPDGPFNVDIPLLQLDYDVRTDLAGDVRGPVARIGLSGTTQEWPAKLTDEAVAGRLGLSLRTLQRRIRQLMDLAGVRTRVQLGWQAAQRGWAQGF
ncbi:helix-turn-helix transcriptional regulator [Nonomuraea sp. NPDC050547]|uniref:helix-turn-helix transcriptional regulator n=1 Tax=Nonomuraea sp. NPDC050547 TaxID=3364368 RepID=UPI003794C09F